MADSTRRVSVRLSLDDAARVKQELREVGETGQRSLERIQGGADRASRARDLLDVAVRGVQIAGLAAGLRAVVVAGDALTQFMGRLNTALGSVERAGEIYDRFYQDSLRTGVAVRESVDAFAGFSIAAREIGATSDQVATLVGGLQRIAIASGATQQEITSSTQQLAQALASGTLQGDELRSILEGLPTLAQALARELGVSIGELRKLGSEGTAIARQVVLHLRVQRPLRQCLLHLVQQPATAKRRAGSRPGQQLVQDRVRYLWLFPSGHGETPSFPHDRSHTKFQTVPRTAASLRAYRQTAARRWRSRTTTSITDGATASGSCSTGSWTGAALSYHVVPKPSPGHHFRRHPHFKSFEPRRMASFSEAGYLIHGRPQPPGMLLFH